ncbi:MAG: family metalloprotease protein [Cryptosporangiaceae bacterium]|jgi:immune inhibitor A|nr:family metalloprotease protein [Cryptosporangiaceae bacterium]
MRKVVVGLLSLTLASGIGAGVGSAAYAAPPVDRAPAAQPASDELPNALESKRRDMRERALADVLSGRATPEERNGSTVLRVGDEGNSRADARATQRERDGRKDQYVELKREKTDRIFVILAEFGDERHPSYPDQDTHPATPGPATFQGPLHDKIPQPDRAQDNSTIWQPNYDRQHFQDLYFDTDPGAESVANYYKTQSSGRYTVDGEVTDWVKVRYNEARYGRSNGYPCASNTCSNTWALVTDAVERWVADRKAEGRTTAELRTELATFDRWDRYDFDGDGDFNEPDGYLDHFQVVHAGGDQADGDPQQGEDAIWSHRWYVSQADTGVTGPDGNKLGGTQVGDTGLWVGDYTIQPENGGLSVFVHEYGHDLGLPDDYDTSGGGDNNNEYWTLMAQSRLSAAGDAGIGTRPGDLGAWNKLQLGWLDYETLVARQKRTLDLGPAEYHSAAPQAAVVVLPKKKVTTELGPPAAGSRQWWSGQADDLANTMTRDLDLTGRSTASLTLQGRYAIERDFDYLYAQLSSDGGANWTSLDGTVDGAAFPRDAAGAPALTGSSAGRWTNIVIPLDTAAGKNVRFRFLYRTDGGVAERGFFADDLTVTADGAPVLSDGAEAGSGGWTLDGFSAVGGSVTAEYDNYYLAANRTHTSYDRYLATGPYNFGFLNTRPDWVEHYSYQQGLLISYWDLSQVDNNTNVHPGEGRNLILDSRPRPQYTLAGTPWRARIQMYDAPFGLARAQTFTLHANGQATELRGQAAQPVFDDTKTWWYADLPNHGVKTPGAGVRIQVVSRQGTSVKVRFAPAK